MKKKLIYWGLIFLALLMQSSFLPVLISPGAMGDAVLMLVLALVVLDGFALALSWAIIAGVLYDFASFTPVGQHVIVFLLLIYAVSFFSRRLSVEVRGIGMLLLVFFVIAATLLSKSLFIFSLMLGSQPVNFFQVFGSFKDFIFQVGGNAVLFFLWLSVLKKFKKTFL
jgi:rod shape-determining protein MreD